MGERAVESFLKYAERVEPTNVQMKESTKDSEKSVKFNPPMSWDNNENFREVYFPQKA